MRKLYRCSLCLGDGPHCNGNSNNAECECPLCDLVATLKEKAEKHFHTKGVTVKVVRVKP